jgi:molybdopterin converting factor small subunit
MNPVTIRIPTPLRGFTKGRDEVQVRAATVAAALAELGEQCPGILERVLDKDGKLRPFVNVFLGSTDVRSLKGLATQVDAGAVLAIVPAVAGGRR